MTFPKPNSGWLVLLISVSLGIGVYLLDSLLLHVLRNSVFDQYQRW